MRIAVASCVAYQDTWKPFLALFNKFWPDCEYKLEIVADTANPSTPWGLVVSNFARIVNEPILLFLDDFFLNAPVYPDLVSRGLQLLETESAGCVRLYPCPGADEPFTDDIFGRVSVNADYRISTMPAIWKPKYLETIASQYNTAWDFETEGTVFSRQLPEPIFATRRDATRWPISIMATGITRGMWRPEAKQLFEDNGIEADLSLRPMLQ